MKLLYLDCGMGAAGDMLSAALLELLPDPDAFLARLNALGLPGVAFSRETAVKCGITGTHISVTVHGEEEGEHSHRHEHHEYDHSHEHGHEHAHEHECPHAHNHEHEHDHHGHGHEHHHSSLHDIEHIVGALEIPGRVREHILAVYRLIAEAESAVHGVPVTEIHFHEVGTMDAVADVTAVCLLLDEIAPDEIIVSPVHVGCGQVRCAHGILPVPAPATALLLKGIPIYGGKIQGELCTPTGAALLRHFAARFGEMPVLTPTAIGYGCGKKDFEAANCVRAVLGEAAEREDTVVELTCNVDDMTAEALGFAVERLLEGGAREAFTIPVCMKKSRPGTMLCVLCGEERKQAVTALLFRHTTTIGVREAVLHRHILRREIETVQTPFGEVRRKRSTGFGVRREKYEYDDLARIAREQGLSLAEVQARLGNL